MLEIRNPSGNDATTREWPLFYSLRTPSGLDQRTPALEFQAFCDRTPGWFGWPALLRQRRDAVDQSLQPAHGFGPVFLEAAEFLSLDDDDAFLADALVLQLQQPFANLGGQR